MVSVGEVDHPNGRARGLSALENAAGAQGLIVFVRSQNEKPVRGTQRRPRRQLRPRGRRRRQEKGRRGQEPKRSE